MNSFLKDCFKFKNVKNICYILGNESCDLDSAVSALSLAYYYNHNSDKIYNKKSYNAFVPILNVSRINFPIKTEVTYYFQLHQIDVENVCFIDEINDLLLKQNDIILVDHHFSPYRENVIQVIDHHQFDSNANLREDCDTTINLVGSCSSLIADLFLKLENHESYNDIFKFLYGPIILDTVNFSKEADKARQLDIDVCLKIEDELNLTKTYKEELFRNLVKERAEISKLNALQILFKDMKLVTNQAKTFKVAIPGYPILVEDYIKLENAEKSVREFAKSQDCSIIVLMGMKVDNECVYRDLGIINIDKEDLFIKIINTLKQYKIIDLELQENTNCKFLDGVFFRQLNVKASRKQILPLIKTIMEEYQS